MNTPNIGSGGATPALNIPEPHTTGTTAPASTGSAQIAQITSKPNRQRSVMAFAPPPRFSGETTDQVQPDDFIKALNMFIYTAGAMEDADRIKILGSCLQSRSEADEWFKENIKDAGSAGRSAEYQRELQELRLTTEELGKKITYAGAEVYTHIAFAHKILDLAKKAKIVESNSSIWSVRDKLPDIIKEEVDEEHDTWVDFHDAIKGIRISRIRDGLAKYRQLQQLQEQMNRMRVSNSGMGTTNQSRPTNSAPTQTTTSNIRTTSRNPMQPKRPLTAEECAAVRAREQEWPMQPDKDSYERQLREWKARFGENEKVSPRTGFPLRPGGAPLFSGECYQCGKTGHRRPECTARGEGIVSFKERQWRALAGGVVGHRGTTQVNLTSVELVDEFAWAAPEPILQSIDKAELVVDIENNNVIDLYSVTHKETPSETPFVHEITLHSADGDATPVQALFDGGAMEAAMCSTVFEQVKSRLGKWSASTKHLRIANGAITRSEARWEGIVELGGIKLEGGFEVFNSHGGWSFLFGKPLLRTFRANQDFADDTVTVQAGPTAPVVVLKNGGGKASRNAQAQATLLVTKTESIFTRHSQPFKAERVTQILKEINIGNDISEEERNQVRALMAEFADCFALSLSEVNSVPGAVHKLNVPAEAQFALRVGQRSLNPEKRADMLRGLWPKPTTKPTHNTST
ncbi:hypothetical protein BD779DRAFT_1679411 [Infundibulicybe gibba]|nr:hypothetical protein BD779DRAFT_1679411 [Infundibulicybe gibba]